MDINDLDIGDSVIGFKEFGGEKITITSFVHSIIILRKQKDYTVFLTGEVLFFPINQVRHVRILLLENLQFKSEVKKIYGK
jgi:hypothetical protein